MNTAIMFASAGSWEWVGSAIENTAKAVNEFFKCIFGFLMDDTIYNNVIGKVPEAVKSAIEAGALSILGVIFIVNFLGKTLNLQWVTWENVLMLLLQLLIGKVCVQNSEWLMSTIQKGFTSMIQTVQTIPDGDPEGDSEGALDIGIDFIDMNNTTEVLLTADLKGGKIGNDITDMPVLVPNGYFFFLEKEDAAKAYWSYDASIRGGLGIVKATVFDFSPAIAHIGVFVNGLIMKAVLAIALIMMIARFMWLAVYTVAAPLSLAMFATDETKDIGKSFIKSYCGVCLHAMVLLIILVSFGAVSASLTTVAGIGGFIGLVKTFALGGMIMKSESVANKLCGAM